MKIDVEKNKDVVIIRLIGCLNYESVDPFHKACLQHLPRKKVIFNFEKLNFVGSIGITPFMDMIMNLLKINKKGVKLCCVGSEFQRIFETSSLKSIEVHESETKARLSFDEDSEANTLETDLDTKTLETTLKTLETNDDFSIFIQQKIKAEIIDN